MKHVSRLLALALLVILTGAAQSTPTKVILRDGFHPRDVTIKVGQSITWINQDDRDYSLKADNNEFVTGNLRPGQGFTHEFKKAGSYPYRDLLKPRFRGTIVVAE